MPLLAGELGVDDSLSAGLHRLLRTAIIDGMLVPGERLVEARIASFYGVSRTPVREALHRLNVDGWVEESGRGIAVSDVGLAELPDLCAVREELEGMAARLAAQQRNEVDIRILQNVLRRLEEAMKSGSAVVVHDLSYTLHRAIAEASRNAYLAGQLERLRLFVDRHQASALNDESRRREVHDTHIELVDAIIRRDSDTAERIAVTHMQDVQAERLLRRRLDATRRNME